MDKLDRLWAPWRLAYVSGEGDTSPVPDDKGCFICRGLAADSDAANLIVERTDLSVVILNRFPYNNGHLLIAPRAHKGRPDELTDAEQLDVQRLITVYLDRLAALMKPDGYNVGLNLGRAAGAGLPGHLHWHVVPRWDGDTNFMPILAGAKVIPQSLEALWELLTAAR
jgi:ATP adenylyltransferase